MVGDGLLGSIVCQPRKDLREVREGALSTSGSRTFGTKEAVCAKALRWECANMFEGQ